MIIYGIERGLDFMLPVLDGIHVDMGKRRPTLATSAVCREHLKLKSVIYKTPQKIVGHVFNAISHVSSVSSLYRIFKLELKLSQNPVFKDKFIS